MKTGKSMAQERMWRECTADSERDIISDCGHVRQRASGRPVLWDSVRSSEFLKWTPLSADFKTNKGSSCWRLGYRHRHTKEPRNRPATSAKEHDLGKLIDANKFSADICQCRFDEHSNYKIHERNPLLMSHSYVTRVTFFISKNYVICWPNPCDVWQNVVMLTNATIHEFWNTITDRHWPTFVLDNGGEINTTFTPDINTLTTNKKCQESGKSLDCVLDVRKGRDWII